MRLSVLAAGWAAVMVSIGMRLAASPADDPAAVAVLPPAPLQAITLPAPPAVRRDPFARESVPAGGDGAGAPDMPLPPNTGAAAGLTPALPEVPPPQPGAANNNVRLLAVVTGQGAHALLEANGATRIVTVGDTVGGATVTALGLGRVELSDGSVLRIETPEDKQP
jgi:hypothetical protein